MSLKHGMFSNRLEYLEFKRSECESRVKTRGGKGLRSLLEGRMRIIKLSAARGVGAGKEAEPISACLWLLARRIPLGGEWRISRRAALAGAMHFRDL